MASSGGSWHTIKSGKRAGYRIFKAAGQTVQQAMRGYTFG